MKKILVSVLSAMLATTMGLQTVVAAANPFVDTMEQVAGANANGIVDVSDKFAGYKQNYASEYNYDEYASSVKGQKTVIVELKSANLADSFLSAKKGAFRSVSEYATSLSGKSISAEITREQSSFLQTLKNEKINYTLGYRYDTIINAVAITVDTADLSAISKLDCVKNIIFSETYAYPQADAVYNNVNAYSTGIYETTGIDYDGEGMVVGILDTGLDYTHDAFQTLPANPSMDKAHVESVVDGLTASTFTKGLTANDLYLTEKVPFQYDYADKDPDVFPVTSSHGTHVAGIIAGYDEIVDYVPLESDTNMYFDLDEDGNRTFKGVATEAQLAIFKVFSDKGEQGAKTEDIVAALNDAVLVNVDIINMSLGSSGGYARAGDDAAVNDVYDRIREAGISLIVAAGNSYSSSFGGTYGNTNLATNPDSSTLGSPSTYNGALSIASISGQLSPYLYINGSIAAYFTNARTAAGKEVDFLTTLLNGAEEKTFNYVVVGGYGEAHNYTSEVRNKLNEGNCIAIVKRGTTSFEDKQKIAAQYGAVGCIIYNNVSGNISASLGTGYKIPTCTITADIATQFIKEDGTGRTGTITLNANNKAGPFMSDFSSWGVSPDLQLYPDVTAHGGYITSAVLGGYSVYSGTSMATPNVAGITALLRQAIIEEYPEMDKVSVNNMIYRLLMSTAGIANNEEGNPYSPRKQGAGVADIRNALDTKAYLYVEGTNKSKIELGDDKARMGEYTLRFRIANTSEAKRSYEFSAYTMTERMSSDGITVAERAYMFNDAKMTVVSVGNGVTYTNGVFEVQGKADAEIVVKLTLTEADKAYLNAHFPNGEFVEGYLMFTDVSTYDKVDLNIPYLAFFGDWLDAPLFDKSTYEVSESKFDDSIPDEDKLQADVYETIVIGSYNRGTESGMALGEYIYYTSDNENAPKPVVSSIDKIAVGYGEYGIYGIKYVYAGLLRGAKTMHVTITNSVTGEIIYETTKYNCRKSITGPGFVELEIEPYQLGCVGNVRYDVSMVGAIDFINGDQVKNNTWNFSFYMDYETPVVSDYNFRTVYNTTGKKTVYLELSVYDNHYTQAIQLFTTDDNDDLVMLTQYPIPVNSNRGGTTKMSIDVTKYMESFARSKNRTNQIGVYLTDYALNGGGYFLPIKWDEIDAISVTDDADVELNTANVELGVGETKHFNVSVLPAENDYNAYDVSFSEEGIVEVKDGYVKALAVGETVVTVSAKNPSGEFENYEFTVVVSDTGVTYDYPVRTVNFATYYDISEQYTMSIVDNAASVRSGLIAKVELNLNPWFANNFEEANITWSSLTPTIVEVMDEYDGETAGVGEHFFRTIKQGTGLIRVEWTYRNVTYSNMLILGVGKKYTVSGGTMYRYNGSDSILEIPANLGAMSIAHYNKYTKGPFNGDKNIKVAIIPTGVTSIGYGTFQDCINLETLYLPATLEGIGSAAFANCTKLKNVYWYTDLYYNTDLDYYSYVDEHGVTQRCFDPVTGEASGFEYGVECTCKNLYLFSSAFENCTSLENFDLSKTTAIYARGMANCTSLKSADLSVLHFAGTEAFKGCTALTEITTSDTTVTANGIFNGCTALQTVDFNGRWIEKNAFKGCTALTTFKVNTNLDYIRESAFEGCTSLSAFTFEGTSVERIEENAFKGCTALTSISLTGTKYLGDQAFVGCTALTNVTFGEDTTLEEFVGSPFFGCTAIREFRASNKNDYLANKTYVKGGVTYYFLYNKDLTTLIAAPNAFLNASGNRYNFTNNPSGTGTVLEEIGNSAYLGFDAGEETLVIPEGVKRIGDRAFYGNTFTTVVLPTTIEYVGESAFTGCTNLVKVVFLGNDNVEMSTGVFYGCSALQEVKLPSNQKEIAAGTFYNTALTKFVVPASVEKIGNMAFMGAALEEVTFEEGSQLTEIGAYAFAQTNIEEIEIPENVYGIAGYAFANTALKSVTIPASVKAWGSFVFTYCESLEEVTFEDGVTFVGAYMFAWVQNGNIYYNRALKTVNLPESVTYVYDYAFAACSALENIDLTNVAFVGPYAFVACSALTDLGTMENLISMGQNAFASCTGLTEIDMPNVKLVNAYAFMGCAALESVNLPAVEQVGPYAFRECAALTEIELPVVTNVYGMAFYGCKALASANFPVVETFGQGVFFGTALTEYTVPATVKEMDIAMFLQCLELKEIKVEEGNERFFAQDGVLYEKLGEGRYQVLAFPEGCDKTSYEVLEGTIRIAEYAFGYTMNLSHVTLPTTLESVGAYGFYYMGVANQNMKDISYTFLGLNAPYIESNFNSESSSIYEIYSNFSYGFGRIKTSISYPANGKGYSGFVWENYFFEPTFLPEREEAMTLSVIDAIAVLMGKEEVTDAEIAVVRANYDSLSDGQKALVKNYADFVRIEAVQNIAKPDVAPTVVADPLLALWIVLGVVGGALVASCGWYFLPKVLKKGGKAE